MDDRNGARFDNRAPLQTNILKSKKKKKFYQKKKKMTSFIIDPRPLDPPEYYDPVETYRATIEHNGPAYNGATESIAYDETNTEPFYDEIISVIEWAIENNEPVTIKIK